MKVTAPTLDRALVTASATNQAPPSWRVGVKSQTEGLGVAGNGSVPHKALAIGFISPESINKCH